MTSIDQKRKAADSASAIDSAILRDDSAEKGSERPSSVDESTYLSGLKLFLAMTSATLVMFLAMLDISIISTVRPAVPQTDHVQGPRTNTPLFSQAIPEITSDFHRLEDVGWYIGAYQLARSVTSLLSHLQDRKSDARSASATIQPLTGKIFTHFNLKVKNKTIIHSKKKKKRSFRR